MKQNNEQNTIPKGYKQTDIGVIPEDWEIRDIGDICNFDMINRGKGINSRKFLLEMGSVSEEGKLILGKTTYSDYSDLVEGDLIMPTRDIGDGRIIGKVAIIKESGKFQLGNNLYKLTPNPEIVLPEFTWYLINSSRINEYLKRRTAKSVQIALNKSQVKQQEIYIPPLSEQASIVDILTDMDSEIEVLEKKLEKYKKIKEGMMQKLLTGQIRLI